MAGSSKGKRSNKASRNKKEITQKSTPAGDPTKAKDGDKEPSFEQLIINTYRIGKKIGAGSYGQIRLGTNVRTNQTVAIKFERTSEDAQLKMENQIYQRLQGQRGFPKVYYFGVYCDYWNVLIMEMLGKNLESVFESCNRKFTLKTMIFIVLQLLKRFKAIHECGFVYRDVKPENFMLGANTNTVFIIDFGLSSPYLDSNGHHIEFKSTNQLIGTSRYMSVNAHLCKFNF